MLGTPFYVVRSTLQAAAREGDAARATAAGHVEVAARATCRKALSFYESLVADLPPPKQHDEL